MRPIYVRQCGYGNEPARRDALPQAAQVGGRRARLKRRRHAAKTGKTGRKAVVTVAGGRRPVLPAVRRPAQRRRAKGLALGQSAANGQQNGLQDHRIGRRQGHNGGGLASQNHHAESNALRRKLEPASTNAW